MRVSSGRSASRGAFTSSRQRCRPRTTAIGALAYYVSHADPRNYQPTNITFGIMEPLVKPPRGKMDRKVAMANRALEQLADWMRDRAA